MDRIFSRWVVCAIICPAVFLAAMVLGRDPGQATNLPYRPQQMDGTGNQWMIYAVTVRSQGNAPVYSESATIASINGNSPSVAVNTGRMGEGGEIFFDNITWPVCAQVRRVLIDKEGVCRVIDTFKNNQAAEQTLNIMYRSSINNGVQSSTMLNDKQKKELQTACVAQDGAGRGLAEVYAGRGAKVSPVIQAPPNNSYVTSTFTVKIPPGKEASIIHLHAALPTTDAANKYAQALTPGKMLAGVPTNVRRSIINVAPNTLGGMDMEILRGENFDVIETRSGESFKGTLKEPTFKIQTLFGPVELKAENVLAMANVGEINPRQVLVTREGDLIAGQLQNNSIALEMTSKQMIQVPLEKVARFGYRKGADESDSAEPAADKPTVWTAGGDRVTIQAPDSEIEFSTRFGPMKLKPESVAALVLQGDEHEVHRVILSDGSQLAGLLLTESLQLKLASAQQSLKFPVALITRMQFRALPDDADDQSTLTLSSRDRLVGRLINTIKLETSFSVIDVRGEEIKRLTPRENAGDFEVLLSDETLVRGRIAEREVSCQLKSGATLKIPVALLEKYANPDAMPPAVMVDSIKELAAALDAEDFKARETAQEKLVSMGPVIVGTLKTLRANASTEAQQRIDRVITAVSAPNK